MDNFEGPPNTLVNECPRLLNSLISNPETPSRQNLPLPALPPVGDMGKALAGRAHAELLPIAGVGQSGKEVASNQRGGDAAVQECFKYFHELL